MKKDVIIFNKVFKTNYSSQLETTLGEFKADIHNDYYNVSTYKKYYYGIMLLIPWNKITYPFIVFLIAFRESQNIKWFFKNIFEHCIWSLNIFKKLDLPNESLRKVVNIPNDASYELRKGR